MGIENGTENEPLKVLLTKATKEALLNLSIPEEYKKDPETYVKAYESEMHMFVQVVIEEVQLHLQVLIEVVSSAKEAHREVYEEFIEKYSNSPDSEHMQDRITTHKTERETHTNNYLSERLHTLRARALEMLTRRGISETTARSLISVVIKQNIKLT